jgi:hypothetical protein
MAGKTDRRGVGGRPKDEPTTVIRLPVPVAHVARRLQQGMLRAGDINAFLDVEASSIASVPLVGGTAACGFPSPADDYLDPPLDFNELLIRNPAATFAVRLASESMTGAGLYDAAGTDRGGGLHAGGRRPSGWRARELITSGYGGGTRDFPYVDSPLLAR